MKPVNRIALVFPFILDPNKGGVQRITLAVGQYLSKNGWDVLYVSTRRSNDHHTPKSGRLVQPEAALGSSADVACYLNEVFANFPSAIAINQIAMDRGIAEALWSLRRCGLLVGLVNCYHANPAAFVQNVVHLIANRMRIPGVGVLLKSRLIVAALLRLHRWRNAGKFRRAYERCDRFMLLSPTFFDELRWYVPDASDERMVAIPNGFPTVSASGSEAEEKQNILLFVGRIENGQKNVLMIPDLWARLAPRLPNWELHVVGDGNDMEAMRQDLAHRGLPRVMIHGWSPPDSHYRRAKIFLMLSSYEGFGNTLIEAQSHGAVPVAFNSYSAAPWILNDGVDAILIKPFDLKSYADSVGILAHDEGLLSAMSVAARRNVARFTVQSMGEAWEMLFSRLTDAA